MNRFLRFSAALLWLPVVCCSWGCESSQAESSTGPPPTVVIVSSPVEESVTDYVDYTGRTDSAETVDIRSRVTGFLDKILFKDGSEVEKGAPLFRIDDREFQADLTAAKGELAKANAEQERTTADFTRVEGLRKKEAVTASQFDQSRAAKLEADAAVQSGTAKEERAELNVTFSKIDAPIAGKISRSRITVGNLVDANSTVLTTIVSVDPMYVYFDVDERTMLALARETREGKLEGRKTVTVPVYMGLTGEKEYPHAGTIDFLENRVNPETGTIRVRGVFSNPRPERGERVIEAGLFARVRVPISKPKPALLVNERAIGTDQGQKFVYVVDSKNEVVLRPIELGAMHGGLRVVTEGLNASEKVIIDGLQRVRPGSVVSQKPGDMRSRPGESVAAATTKDKSDKAGSSADPKPSGQQAH
jgi:RND family efflux transporter MFP subunit